MDVRAFLLADLAENGPQSSWDWQADLRFACAAGRVDEAVLLGALNDSFAPLPLQIDAHDLHVRSTVTAPRLRGLRALVREGIVQACWRGTGPGGVASFGIGRARSYVLTDSGR